MLGYQAAIAVAVTDATGATVKLFIRSAILLVGCEQRHFQFTQ